MYIFTPGILLSDITEYEQSYCNFYIGDEINYIFIEEGDLNIESFKRQMLNDKHKNRCTYGTIMPEYIEIRMQDEEDFILRSKFKDFKELYSLMCIGKIDLRAESHRRELSDYMYVPIEELI